MENIILTEQQKKLIEKHVKMLFDNAYCLGGCRNTPERDEEYLVKLSKSVVAFIETARA
jgi:hypothetical protein